MSDEKRTSMNEDEVEGHRNVSANDEPTSETETETENEVEGHRVTQRTTVPKTD